MTTIRTTTTLTTEGRYPFEGRLRANATPRDIVRAKPQPAAHRATAHDHLLGRRRLDELRGLGRVDADQDPALAARGDGHVAVHEERKAAEHLPLGHATLAGDEVANARREPFVVRHRPRY
jgi:hypothetical protein